MLFFIALIATAQSWTKDELAQDLQSAEGQVKLFSQFLNAEGVDYPVGEKALRFRKFRTSLKEVVKINSEQDSWESTINFMSAMTEEEKQQYHGINITANPVGDWDAEESQVSQGLQAGSVDWRTKGAVTEVRSQGSCGSCWTFAGICSFEGHYKQKTNSLKRFAEQEFLDCTYSGSAGCQGGWYWEAFDKTVAKTQHLALSKDYAYTAIKGSCRSSSTTNGMTGAKCSGTARVSRGSDSALASALNSGPVAIAFEIKGAFHSYKSGILKVTNCGGTPHHAMGMVGYTASYWDIKNSWGSRWGDQGFVKFSRQISNMCGVANWAAYPKLSGSSDNGGDNGGNNSGDNSGSCSDTHKDCATWSGKGYCGHTYVDYMAETCKKSCNKCDGGNNSGGCSDKNNDCATWSGKGYCGHTYVAYMAENCQKSCNKC